MTTANMTSQDITTMVRTMITLPITPQTKLMHLQQLVGGLCVFLSSKLKMVQQFDDVKNEKY